MKNLQHHILLIGLFLSFCYCIYSVFSASKDAHASSVKKIAICDKTGTKCANTLVRFW